MDSQPLWDWINERHAIYLRKTLRDEGMIGGVGFVPNFEERFGAEFAWAAGRKADGQSVLSRDPIFQEYRFCNVFRELDRVTTWIRYHIRRRYAGHPNLWLMLAIARTINWPLTLQFLIESQYAWPDHDAWTPADLTRALDYYAGEGHKIYTGAYMIRAESNPKADWYSWSKQRYIAEIVIGRLWEDRQNWMTYLTTDDPSNQLLSLRDVWELFQQPRYIGWGPFMAYQVVVDMRWTRYLRNAPDIQTWAALGPGSRRGLNRLYGRPVDFPLSQEQGLEEMLQLHRDQHLHRAPWVPPIDLSDIQNSLCETDKYLRVKLGEGKPRAKYVPGRGY